MSVAFSPDSRYLVSAGGSLKLGPEIRVWNVDTRALEASFIASGARVCAFDARFSPDGTRILAAKGDGVAEQWQWPSQTWLNAMNQKGRVPIPIQKQISGTPGGAGVSRYWFLGNLERLMGVDYSPDGKIIGTCGWSPSFQYLWRSDSGKPLSQFAPFERAFSQIAFAPDGKRFLTVNSVAPQTNLSAGTPGIGDGAVYVWDISTNKPVATLPITNACYAAWSPNSKKIAVSILGARQSVQIFDVSSRISKTVSSVATCAVYGATALAWSPDSRLLAVHLFDNIAIVDAANGKSIQYFGFPNTPATKNELKQIGVVRHTVSWSPDGHWIAAAHKQQVLFWDAKLLGLKANNKH